MPCVEIADSIVQTGRETLEKAITLIQSRPEWKADVGATRARVCHLPALTAWSIFRSCTATPTHSSFICPVEPGNKLTSWATRLRTR